MVLSDPLRLFLRLETSQGSALPIYCCVGLETLFLCHLKWQLLSSYMVQYGGMDDIIIIIIIIIIIACGLM